MLIFFRDDACLKLLKQSHPVHILICGYGKPKNNRQSGWYRTVVDMTKIPACVEVTSTVHTAVGQREFRISLDFTHKLYAVQP